MPVWGVVWRAQAAVWLRRARYLARRPQAVSVLLVILGLGAGLAGGALVGEWCLGVVMIAEAGLLVFAGFSRDDGQGVPRAGERTHEQILAEAARRQW